MCSWTPKGSEPGKRRQHLSRYLLRNPAAQWGVMGEHRRGNGLPHPYWGQQRAEVQTEQVVQKAQAQAASKRGPWNWGPHKPQAKGLPRATKQQPIPLGPELCKMERDQRAGRGLRMQGIPEVEERGPGAGGGCLWVGEVFQVGGDTGQDVAGRMLGGGFRWGRSGRSGVPGWMGVETQGSLAETTEPEDPGVE